MSGVVDLWDGHVNEAMVSKLQGILSGIEAKCDGRFTCYDSVLHGIGHLREVALLAGEIAFRMGQDVEAAMVAGFLHDCGRVDDAGGRQHAIDSVAIARPVLEECFPHLALNRICDAIARHADGTITDDPVASAVWDADRLTLSRLGKEVREELLSTPAAKEMLRKRRIAEER